MSEVLIETDVPPPRRQCRGPREKYPFSKMEIGNSFFVPRGLEEDGAIRRTVSIAGKRLSRTFTCRAVEGGYRVWRIE